MSPSLRAFIESYSQRVNHNLSRRLPAPIPGSERLLDAMRYSLLQGGKRIRPILAYASAEAVGSVGTLTDSVACALECIHAYSLIHDDLPAMDNDDLRRGEPTCHVAFDEATAILAGDALQTLAFEILAAEAVPATLPLVQELARAAGARGMAAGQAVDQAAVSRTLSLPQLEQMHRHKTGALIEASVVMGAMSTDGASQSPPSQSQLSSLRTYAAAIGLAFQVQDDILDVTGATQELGKRQGADQELNKPTYVALLGIDEARSMAAQLHAQARQALETFGSGADMLRDLATYVVERRS